MTLKELLKEMRKNMDRYDLSDDYLISHGCNTRMIGEFQYGVSMVPCDWVYPYLNALAGDRRLDNLVKDIEEDPMAYMGRVED